ncbi:hypothetical protein D3C78_1993960 [compost metagenome]
MQSGEWLDVRTDDLSFSVWLAGECVGDSPAFANIGARDAAIEALRVALTPAQD